MHMLSPLVKDTIGADNTGLQANAQERPAHRTTTANSEETRNNNRALFLNPIPPEGNIAIKTMRGAVKLSNAGFQSAQKLLSTGLQSGIDKLKVLCDENNHNPKTKRTREIGLWALAGITALTTISTAIKTISKLKNDDGDRPNILMSIAQIFTGLSLSLGIVNTLKGRKGAGFGTIRSIMWGIGVLATLSFVNSLARRDGKFSKLLKPFGITAAARNFFGPMDTNNLGQDIINMPIPPHVENQGAEGMQQPIY